MGKKRRDAEERKGKRKLVNEKKEEECAIKGLLRK